MRRVAPSWFTTSSTIEAMDPWRMMARAEATPRLRALSQRMERAKRPVSSSSSTMSLNRRRRPVEAPATWGVTNTFGICKTGESSGIGSGSNTSRPAKTSPRASLAEVASQAKTAAERSRSARAQLELAFRRLKIDRALLLARSPELTGRHALEGKLIAGLLAWRQRSWHQAIAQLEALGKSDASVVGATASAFASHWRTTSKGPDPHLVALAQDADVLIYDSMYTEEEYPSKVGWGHSTWEAGIAVAEAANVERLVLFHHDPFRTDADLAAIHAEVAAQTRIPVDLAIEGSVIDI